MEILEHQVVGKQGRPDLCEDVWTATPHYACVIDGATTKGDLHFDMQTSGRMAALLLKEAVKRLPPHLSCEEAVAHFTDFIAEFCKARRLYNTMRDNHWDRIAASMAVYSADRKEVWLIGDCQCLVAGQVHQVEKAIDRVLAEMRANYIKALLQTGTSEENLMIEDQGRQFILPLLKNQSQYQNAKPTHPYAYGLIDGFPVHPGSVKVVPVPDGEPVVLASDGYPRLFDTLKESEAYLKKVIEDDPLCIHLHPATKGLQEGWTSFDDRVYLKVKATGS